MNTSNLSPQPNIEEIRDLLSPYLDNEVTPLERQQIEQALLTSPELHAELESLQQTIALLKALPSVPAPRPFTLTEADVPLSTPSSQRFWGLFPAWVIHWAESAAVLCILILIGVFLFSPLKMGTNSAPKMAAEVAMQPQPTAEPTITTAPNLPPAEAAPSLEETSPEPMAKMAAPAMSEAASSEEAAGAAADQAMTALSAPEEGKAASTELKATEIITMQPAKEAAPFGATSIENESPRSSENAVIETTQTPTPTPPQKEVVSNRNWIGWLIWASLFSSITIWAIRHWVKTR